MRKHLRLSLGKTFEDDSAIKTLNVGEFIEVTATVDVENVNYCQIMIDFDQKILDLISKNKLFKFEGGSYIKDISFILKASNNMTKEEKGCLFSMILEPIFWIIIAFVSCQA